MDLTAISPDQLIFWQWGFFTLNSTLLFTWLVMALLIIGSWWLTRNLSSTEQIPRWQHLLEMIIEYIQKEIEQITQSDPKRYLPFIGTLFLFIALSNALAIVPGFIPPTMSLSTAAALAILVFVAVPIFGISEEGLRAYMKRYIKPTPLMIPFQIIGEISRTLALAVRLFGNVLSGAKIVALLVALVPLFFPIVMSLFGLITGLIQAYIFSVLAIVYIASGSQPQAKGSKSHG